MAAEAEAPVQGPGRQVEHRYRAVMEVLDGSPVSKVAVRYGVSRQSVYSWRDRYAAGGIDGLRNLSRRPRTSPSRLLPRVQRLKMSQALAGQARPYPFSTPETYP